jgi:hypothetical protein
LDLVFFSITQSEAFDPTLKFVGTSAVSNEDKGYWTLTSNATHLLGGSSSKWVNNLDMKWGFFPNALEGPQSIM